jgi:hypothetical protein
MNRPAMHQKRLSERNRTFKGGEGFDFVRCRICGDHRRVLSGRHLSKHGTDREEYMQEYGLSPDELIAKDFRIIRSSRRGYRPYGRSDWIAAIKKLQKQGGSLFGRDLQKKRSHIYHQGVWLFGDWNSALRAARFNPERNRLRRSWNAEEIIKQIRWMHKQSLPLYARYVMMNHQSLFSGALHQYGGSWNEAVAAAGIKNKIIREKSRDGLLRELRDAVESGSEISQTLRSEIDYYFGSLRNAKIALKTNAKLLSGWSKRKIVIVLAQKHRSQEKLDYATGRREFPALVSAAEVYFGSWGKALYAAGIDPNFVFRAS